MNSGSCAKEYDVGLQTSPRLFDPRAQLYVTIQCSHSKPKPYIALPSHRPSLHKTPTMADTSKEGSHPTEDQKKAIYEGLSEDQKKKQSYTEWVKDAYNNQYENWMPWIEDKYLAWFGTDNKASYATKVRTPALVSPLFLSCICTTPLASSFCEMILTNMITIRIPSTRAKSPVSPKSTSSKMA